MRQAYEERMFEARVDEEREGGLVEGSFVVSCHTTHAPLHSFSHSSLLSSLPLPPTQVDAHL